jgi:hypothetical protein
MYDANGDPLWYFTSAAAPSLQGYSSQWLQLGNGPTLSGPYRPPRDDQFERRAGDDPVPGADVGVMTLPGNRTTTIRRYRF